MPGCALWVNISEVLPYFLLIMLIMRKSLPGERDIVPVNLIVFSSQFVWDAVLIFIIIWVYVGVLSLV